MAGLPESTDPAAHTAPTTRISVAIEEQLWRFEQAWQQEQRPHLDDFLPSETALRQRLLVELVHTDLEFRLTRAREPARAEEYLQRYPELAGDRDAVLALIAAEFRLRRGETAEATVEEYLQRFPAYAADLQARLQELLRLRAAPAAGAPAAMPSVAGYEVLEELGRGGMGVVYRARSRFPSRLVALKMLRSGVQADPEELAQFRAEIEAVARLQHSHIVPVYEVGEWAGRPYFTMELLGGGSLAARLSGRPEPSARRAAELVRTLADAIQAAHQQRIVHRDLKPSNVLLTADGIAKIADFGLATVLQKDDGQTWTGPPLGTPAYMAPEQAGGGSKRIGPATDVYALGAVLYELLTGRPPFCADTPQATIVQLLTDEPVPPRRLWPTVPRDLETICLKCLHKDPRRRYPTARALADDLGRFLEQRPIHARPASAVDHVLKWVRRRPAVAALTLLLCLLVLAGSIGAWVVNVRLHQSNENLKSAVERAERNEEHALKAAEVMVSDVAEVVGPIAGTDSDKVRKILADADAIYRPLVEETNSRRARMGKGRLLNDQVEVLLEMNDSGSALESARAAVLLFGELSQREPDDPAVLSERARGHHKLAQVLDRRGDLRGAAANYRDAHAQYRRLAAADDGNAEWASSQAQVGFRLASVLSRMGDDAEIDRLYRQSFALSARAAQQAPAEPRYREQLALAHEKMADLHLRDGKSEQARAELEAARRLIEAGAGNARSEEAWCRVNTTLGTTYFADNPARARACYEESQRRATAFCKINPSSIYWQYELQRCRVFLIQVTLSEKASAESLRAQLAGLTESDAALQRFADKDRAAKDWPARRAALQQLRGLLHLALARSSGEPGHQSAALGAFTAAAAIQLELCKHDAGNAEWLERLARSDAMRGNLLQQLHRPEQARVVLKEALEYIQRFEQQRPLPRHLQKLRDQLRSQLDALRL